MKALPVAVASAVTLGVLVAIPEPAQATTAAVEGGWLKIVGTGAEANVITVTWQSDGSILVREEGTAASFSAGAGCTSTEPKAARCVGMHLVEVTLGDGDDRYLDSGLRFVSEVTVYGGSGDDRITSMSGRNKYFYGGPGDDVLEDSWTTSNGSAWMDGGAGKDTLVDGPGFGRLVGRAGNDLISGGEGRDFLRGSQGRDVLRGGQQEDRLRGEEGADTLIGGRERDRLKSGPGADRINARDTRKDLVDCGHSLGGGPDRLTIDRGHDILRDC